MGKKTDSKQNKAIAELKKKLEAQGITLAEVNNVAVELKAKLFSKVNENYEKWKKENQWHADDPIPEPIPEPEPTPEPEPQPEPEPEPVPEPTPEPEPIPEPAPGGGTVLWDSNVDGKWNNGQARVIVKSEGGIGPNGKGIECRASGNPKLVIDGNGIAHLVSGSGEAQDLSLKLRSRHNEEGDCANRFGGFGCSIDRTSVGMKTESCHNNHENSASKSGLSIKNGEWHKASFSCKDGSDGVDFECMIDGVSKMKHSHKNPAPAYVDKAKFAENSYFWIRTNNSDHGRIYVYANNYNSVLTLEFKFDGGNSISLKNVKLTAL